MSQRVSEAESDAEVLLRLAEATAHAIGAEFFASLVRHLSQALGAPYAFVAEFAGSPSRVRSLAYWADGELRSNFEYDLAGTPCEAVAAGETCHHPRGVATKFPADRWLAEIQAESYLGVPLRDAAGVILGHVALMDTRPMPEEPRRLAIFRIFAARAAAELQRVRMERALAESERRFRDLFDEAPIGYVYEDTDTRFVSANQAFQKMLGLRPEEVSRTRGLSLVAPTEENQARVHDSLEAERAGKEKPFIEIELRRKDDGRSVWVQRFSRPGPDGRYTRTMVVDITARVLAEQERNRLRAQNEYLQEEIKNEYNFEEIIGRSSSLRGALASSALAPRTSRIVITVRCASGSSAIARSIRASVSPFCSRVSGSRHSAGASPQWPSSRKRSASTGLSRSSSARASAEKGRLRASRVPRVFARFAVIVNSQVRKELRPSKRASPFSTATQASCAISSASAVVRTCALATRTSAPW